MVFWEHIVFQRKPHQIMLGIAPKLVQTIFISSRNFLLYEILDISSFSYRNFGNSKMSPQVISISESRFFTWRSRWALLVRCYRCGNEPETSGKTSTFQNTKNYWNWLIIQKVTKDNVMEFGDEKWQAFYACIHLGTKKRVIFHHQTSTRYPL